MATATEICTGARSSRGRPPPSTRAPRPPTRHAWRPGVSPRLACVPFSGPVDSAGGLLHTPWRIPTARATFQLSGPTDAVSLRLGPALWPGFRIIPSRPSCLPGEAHAPPALAHGAQPSGPVARPFGVRGADEGRVPRSRRSAPYRPQLPGGGYPGRNFGGNQLPGGSMSLSPPRPARTSDLHVSTAAGLHQAFAWLRPGRA